MVDKQNFKIAILVSFFIGGLIGMLGYDRFLADTYTELPPKIITKTEYIPIQIPVVDSVPVIVKVPEYIYIKDTIIKDKVLPLNNYVGSEKTINGLLYYDITTAGYLTSYKFRTDYKIKTFIPQTTTTISTTKIKNKNPKGLYFGILLNQQLTPFGKVDYLDNQYIFSYQYSPIGGHAIGVSKKLF